MTEPVKTGMGELSGLILVLSAGVGAYGAYSLILKRPNELERAKQALDAYRTDRQVESEYAVRSVYRQQGVGLIGLACLFALIAVALRRRR